MSRTNAAQASYEGDATQNLRRIFLRLQNVGTRAPDDGSVADDDGDAGLAVTVARVTRLVEQRGGAGGEKDG